jgi:cell division topological specificity factor
MSFFGQRKEASKIAEERLKLILIQDRLFISSEEFESLKEDIMQVLSKYFDIEKDSIQINIERNKEKSIFEEKVPVIPVKRAK